MFVDRIINMLRCCKSYCYKELFLNPEYKKIIYNKNNKKISDKILILFVHYDEKNILSESDLSYIDKLKSIGDVIFITNSYVNLECYDVLMNNIKGIIKRDNIGFDFGAWKDAILKYEDEIKEYNHLILANNSVFSPIYRLSDIFIEMNDKNNDFWGITAFTENDKRISREAKNFPWKRIPFHIQSYFLVFERRTFCSDCFIDFWKKLIYPKSFAAAVQYGEIALSQLLLKNGFRCGVLIEETLSSKMFHYDGPDLTKNEPDTLLYLGCPFIKKKSLPIITKKQFNRIKDLLNKNNKVVLGFVLDYCSNMRVNKVYSFLNAFCERMGI